MSDPTVQLHIDGQPLTVKDGRVVVGGSTATRWRLVQDDRTGQHNYVIIDAESGFLQAWKAADSGNPGPVEVGMLPVGKSLPPYYPPNGVWVLELVDNDTYSITNVSTEMSVGVGKPGDPGEQPLLLLPQGTGSKVVATRV
uniref:I66 family serine proteinase inhibitor n=1 Tax=Streptomyces sp. NBC_00003 TaxID=2903608 RepID=A0AAU2UYU7_9ACTN